MDLDERRIGVDRGRYPLFPFGPHARAEIDTTQRAGVVFVVARASHKGPDPPRSGLSSMRQVTVHEDV